MPTLNLRLSPELLRVPAGVYAVETPCGTGVANYGVAPTWGEQAWPEPVLEVHLVKNVTLPAVAPDRLTVVFKRFIRPERTFPNLEALREQIARDIHCL